MSLFCGKILSEIIIINLKINNYFLKRVPEEKWLIKNKKVNKIWWQYQTLELQCAGQLRTIYPSEIPEGRNISKGNGIYNL